MSDLGDPNELPNGPTVQEPLPEDALALVELDSTEIERRLGYFRDEPFVVFGYCSGGGEVIWRDGRSSGFGTGGWQVFLEEIAPVAAKHRANLGSLEATGSHVLIVDRIRRKVYVSSRQSAEAFVSRIGDLRPASRRCMCGWTACPGSAPDRS